MSAENQSGIVVLIQDSATREITLTALRPLGPLWLAEDTQAAETLLREQNCGVLVVEDELPGEPGLMFFARINHLYPWLRRILICSPLEPDLLLLLINEANVFRCLTKPLDGTTLRAMAGAAMAAHQEARRLLDSAQAGKLLLEKINRPERDARRWLATMPRLFSVVVLTFGWIVLIGSLALGILYVLKSALGIDLVEGMHLRDLFR